MRIVFPLLAAVVVVGLTACASHSHRLQGTDLPRVPETTVESNTLVFSQRRAESGKVEFTGPIYDALERARWTARGFALDGWKEVSLGGTATKATAVFSSSLREPNTERIATLHIVASQVRGMATIAIELRKMTKKTDESGAKDDTK